MNLDGQHLRIAGGGVDRAREQLAEINKLARTLLDSKQFAEAHNLLYDAEAIAYECGMFDLAAEYRKAQSVIRDGDVPTVLIGRAPKEIQ